MVGVMVAPRSGGGGRWSEKGAGVMKISFLNFFKGKKPSKNPGSGTVHVRDESRDPSVWVMIESVKVGTTENVVKVLKKHGLTSGWFFDTKGNRDLVTV
jgi:hypothetical protein